MDMTLCGDGILIDTIPCEYKLTRAFLPIFCEFNKRYFSKKIQIPIGLEPFVSTVYGVFNQDASIEAYPLKINGKETSKSDVIIGFSGGLDSAYHALCLKEEGYNVHLFHIHGLNSYENNNAFLAAESFARKHNLDLIVSRVKKTKDNPCYWIENPVKNQLILSLMIDIAIENGYGTVSIGDDASMSFKRPDFILGTNTTDCREVQEAYECGVKHIVGDNIAFNMIKRQVGSIDRHKGERISKLIEYDSLDLYYSCVGAGRFNQYNRNKTQEKYNISLPKWNCGHFCAKCAMHNLLMFYQRKKDYPQDFIDACWDRLWKTKHGNIATLFSPSIPLKTRIDNLFFY